MNWLTIVIILLFSVCFYAGMKRGFVKTVFSIVFLAAGLLLSVVISPYVSNYLHNNDSVYTSVYQAVKKNVKLDGHIETLKQENSIIDELPLPEALREKVKENNNAEVYKALGVKNFKKYVYKYITNMIINGISYVGVYILVTICLYVLSVTLDIISKLPVLNEINHLAGGAVGLLQGLLIFWIFCAVLAIFSNFSWAQKLYGMINESVILSILYDMNILLKIITNLKNSFF